MTHDAHHTPAQRLKAARAAAGYPTAADAARAFGWPEVRYRHHENGTRGFKIDSAVGYGKAFKVSPAWLVGWSTEESRSISEDLRDYLLRGEAKNGRDIGDALFNKYRISTTTRVNISDLADHEFPNLSTSKIKNGDFVLLDADIVRAAGFDDDNGLLSIVIDHSVQIEGIPAGSIVLINRIWDEIKFQNTLWVYSYGDYSGLCRFWVHPDSTVELRSDSGGESGLRVPLTDLRVWGPVVWMGLHP